MRVLQMEVVIRAIEVCWHDSYVISTILEVIAFTHLKTCYLCNSILLVAIFQWRSQQTILAHWLWCVLWIDTRTSKEEKFLYLMKIALLNNIALHLHILHDEVCTIEIVCHNTSNESSSKDNGIRFLFIKETLHSLLICQI